MPKRRKESTNIVHGLATESTVYPPHHHHRCSDMKEKPQQRNAANARERARMRVLSRAFCRLKTTLPWVPADTKLSKLDTLRLATTYIGHLRSVLIEGSTGSTLPTSANPKTMSWPFIFNKSNNTPSNSPPSGSESPSSSSDLFGFTNTDSHHSRDPLTKQIQDNHQLPDSSHREMQHLPPSATEYVTNRSLHGLVYSNPPLELSYNSHLMQLQ